jgi:L,D-transpeptidase ErfK/SrfK
MVSAATYVLPPAEEALIGSLTETTAHERDTLLDVARRYGLGYQEIVLANPQVDRWLPGDGTRILLPTRFILPDAPRKGIVLNLAEMRLYYYPQPKAGELPQVMTFPVSIGRVEWATPLAVTRVIAKVENPSWYPPESIRAEHEAGGDELPKRVPPGPDNPLGRFALKLGLRGYLFHGTNKAYGIGMRVSHGCVRLYPQDIAVLFKQVPKGAPVRIVNQQYKVAAEAGVLYLEAHPPSGEPAAGEEQADIAPLVDRLLAAVRERPDWDVYWGKAEATARDPRGIPTQVGGASALSAQ